VFRRDKVSFHASGVILSSGGRRIGANLRLLTHRSYLCSYFPKHPDHWPEVRRVRNRDMIVRHLIQDECPLTVELFYQPAGGLPILSSHLAKGIFVAPVEFTGIEGHGRVLLHLAFARQPAAINWAPRWVIGYPSISEVIVPGKFEQWFEPGS
jgi:hypothetical protein